MKLNSYGTKSLTPALLLFIMLYNSPPCVVLHCLNDSGFSVASLIHFKYLGKNGFTDIHLLLTAAVTIASAWFTMHMYVPRRCAESYNRYQNSQNDILKRLK